MQGVSAVLFLVFPSTRPAGTVFCRLRLVAFTVNSETEGWVPPNNDSCVCGPCGRVNLRQMGKKKWGVCLFVCLDLVLYSRWVCICACWDELPKTWNQVVFEVCKKKNWIWILFILVFLPVFILLLSSVEMWLFTHTHTLVCKKVHFIKDEAWKIKFNLQGATPLIRDKFLLL